MKDVRRGLLTKCSVILQVFNLQRLAVLTASLGASPLDPNVIWESMRDKVHQPQREGLVSRWAPPPLALESRLTKAICRFQIPGLSKIVNTMTPATHPGLLGICLSGAGPTILALVSNEGAAKPAAGEATPQMREVGEAIKALWQQDGIEVEWLPLEMDDKGATLEEHK